MSSNNHPFHLVPLSPWPILTSFSLLFVTGGGVLTMHSNGLGHAILLFGLLATIFFSYSWWRDVIKEGREDKAHTEPVRHGLRIGMSLFILSEVMFFFAFFWSFFNASITPAGLLDGVWVAKEGVWPPTGIQTFDPWSLPFFNTLVLLLSGTTVTWAHHAIVNNNQKDAVTALTYTVLLGMIFTATQAYEYHHAAFGFTDGVYASNFFMATGFHGAHVIIGTIFLAICLFRAKKGHFNAGHGHLGFEFAAWYWHFVDVVWLFLFIFVYVWGR